MNDWDLLKAYAEKKSEDAFAELVRRYVNLVHSAALRQVGGDAHLAQDVTQCVFNDLARKASTISERTVLSGWLYTSARYAASGIVRTEQRRQAREREAHFMNEPADVANAPDWEQLQTVLDEAMHDLKESDRNAILLRYFQGCNYQDVAAKIGVSPDSARMRVDRALEKLRGSLQKRGVASTAAALTAILAQQSITAAPAALAATVATSAMSAVAATGTAATFFQFMAMTKLKAGAIAVAIAGISVPLVLQHQANQDLARANAALTERYNAALGDLAPLKEELARTQGRMAVAPKTPDASNEVFQLRAEVARLRDEARGESRTRAIASATQGEDPVQQTLRTLGLRAEKLKQRLALMPEIQIPELALIDEKDWLDAASNVDSLETDADFRRALQTLRERAKQKSGNLFQKALGKFAEANGDQLPSDLAQLQPFFEKPIDPAVLQRYQMVHSGKYSEATGDHDLIKEIAPPVDEEFESLYTFRRNGSTSRNYNRSNEAIQAAVEKFAEANNGHLPRSASQLGGLAPANLSPDRIQQFLSKIPLGVTTLEQLRNR